MTTPPEQPDLEERIANLAKRLHYHGPNAREQIMHRALKALEESLSPPRPERSAEERAAFWASVREGARKYREEHPCDPANPESRVWQEELYDENGLPVSAERLAKAERAERMQRYVDFGVKYREANPYDDHNPPSRAWQDELYDDKGLPWM